QVVNAKGMVPILYADTHPDVWHPWKLWAKINQPSGPFCKNLETMPICTAHNIKHTEDELFWDILVE
ncbi:unnamed protein product, partial [marine sediment metagenome]